jgi:hypothetical protein
VLYVVVAEVAAVGSEKDNKVIDQHQHQHYYHRQWEVHKGFLAKIAMTA